MGYFSDDGVRAAGGQLEHEYALLRKRSPPVGVESFEELLTEVEQLREKLRESDEQSEKRDAEIEKRLRAEIQSQKQDAEVEKRLRAEIQGQVGSLLQRASHQKEEARQS